MTVKYLNFTIFLGFVSSLMICSLFGPFIVSSKTERYWHNVSLSALESVFTFTVIFTLCMEIRFILRKEKFHRSQTVFWPKRCCHCFQMLSHEDSGTRTAPVSHERDDTNSEEITNAILSATSTSIQECARYSSSTQLHDGALNHLSDTSNENERLEHTNSETPITSLETPCLVRRCSMTPMSGSNGEVSHGLCTGKHLLPGPHRALLNVYGVFCFVSCVGMFLQSIRYCICYGQGEYPAWKTFRHVAANMGIIIALPTTLAFVNAYIDAFYVDSYQNLVTIALLLILSIWKCADCVLRPIKILLESRYSNNETVTVFCRINGTFFDIYDHIDHIAGPFYTETSMIMLGISLQLWSSFVSKTSINSRRNPIAMESCNLDISFSISRRCSISLIFKQSFRRFLNLIRSQNSENQPLISRNTSHRFSKVRFVTWIVFVTANLPYLGLSLMYVFHPSEIAEQFHENNILMSFEIIFCCSFSVLCNYAKLKEKKIPHVSYSNDVGSSWKLKGHEIMLIVCSYGIFTQCILLLTAGAGNLINNGNLMSPEEHMSCKIAIVYSVIKILTAWQMTVFLSRIPRQKCDNPSEHVKIKWILVCLISVMVICGVQWLITSLENKTFLLQRLYFGDKAGKAIGILLEPFGTIYSLHAATVAYELYGEILSRMKWLFMCGKKDRHDCTHNHCTRTTKGNFQRIIVLIWTYTVRPRKKETHKSS